MLVHTVTHTPSDKTGGGGFAVASSIIENPCKTDSGGYGFDSGGYGFDSIGYGFDAVGYGFDLVGYGIISGLADLAGRLAAWLAGCPGPQGEGLR